MSRTHRLFQMMTTLRRLPTPVRAVQLANELDISLRTVYRDIDALRGLGAVIDGEAGFGYTLIEDATLPPLGFEDDERDCRIGAHILRNMGFGSVRLMTNNPAKVVRMEEAGLAVTERVPHRHGETPENAGYLATKASKSGHLL